MTAPDRPVLVEALLMHHSDGTGFSWRTAHTVLDHMIGPDATVRALAGLAPGDHDTVVHSTSWRADPDGRIVLTYLVWPDPRPDSGSAPVGADIARGADPGHPTPEALDPPQVAAHALSHLAWLADTDPVIAMAVDGRPGVRRALADIVTLPAGRLQST